MKITKLSLATIIALGSISSVNAQNLEDAIKNVEVSGTVAYRYNDYEESTSATNTNKSDGSDTSNNYKAAINVGTTINDDLKFNSRFIAGNIDNAGELGLDSQKVDDGNVDVFLSEVNFSYTGLENSVFTLGKQGVVTPFTLARDAMGNEATGTGIVASTHIADMVSLSGGYFNQTNFNTNDYGTALSGSNDFYYVSGNLALAGMTLDAAYADSEDQFDAYTVGLTANYDVAGASLSPYARYSSLDLENSNLDNTLWKVGMSAKAGIFGAYLAYGETNEEGGVVGIDGSSDTGMDDHWRVTLSGIKDASAVYASVNTQVTDKINVALKYSGINAGTNTGSGDQNEIYVQALYQMSANFYTYARLGQLEKDDFYDDGSDLDSTIGRIHLQYSF